MSKPYQPIHSSATPVAASGRLNGGNSPAVTPPHSRQLSVMRSRHRRCGHGIAAAVSASHSNAAAVTASRSRQHPPLAAPLRSRQHPPLAAPLRSRHRRCGHGIAAANTATPLRSRQRRCGHGNAAAVTATPLRSRQRGHGAHVTAQWPN